MNEFARSRNLPDPQTRIALSEGSPGLAATLDLDQFRERRALMLAAFDCGAGLSTFSAWIEQSENFGARKAEKLETYLKIGYSILEDTLAGLYERPAVRNRDVEQRIAALARAVNFAWVEGAVRFVDELVVMVRRNIQKTGALDAMIINLRNRAEKIST